MPRFRNLKTKEKNFLRGYALDWSTGGSPDAKYFPLYGEALQKAVESIAGRGLQLHGAWEKSCRAPIARFVLTRV